MSDARTKALKALDPKVVLAVARKHGGDGWTIFAPSEFTDLGVPVDTVAFFIEEHESGVTPKEKIFTDGGVVENLRGVYILDFMLGLAYALVPDFKSTVGGRGFASRQAADALIKHFSKEAGDGDSSRDTQKVQ